MPQALLSQAKIGIELARSALPRVGRSRESQPSRELKELLAQLRTVITARNDSLFSKFLPAGYRMTMLDSVDPRLVEKAILAKVRIGTLITIYDDYADNPRLRDPELLKELYQIPYGQAPRGWQDGAHFPVVQLVTRLWNDVFESLREMPNFSLLADLLEFDVQQFYNANRYSELVSANPLLSNQTENRAYMAHNMGIVLVGTVDLMASPALKREELGRIRAFLHRSQTAARLMNVVATLGREIAEGDVTGEVVSTFLEQGGDTSKAALEAAAAKATARMNAEIEQLYSEISKMGKSIQSFDASRYVGGLRGLQRLHQSMQAEI